MAVVKTEEYYETCQGCGAPFENKTKCSFCGNSFVKSMTEQYLDSSKSGEEAAAELEDKGLAVVRGKVANIGGGEMIFYVIFSGMFLGVPTFILFIFLLVGLMEWWMIFAFGVFYLVGGGVLVSMLRTKAMQKKCEKGRPLEGIVRGYLNSNFYINDNPVLIVKLRVEENGEPKLLYLKTGTTTRPWSIGSRVSLRNSGEYYLFVG